MSENSVEQNRLSSGIGMLKGCLNCPDRQKVEVRLCQFFDCSLHPFRMGTEKTPTRVARGNPSLLPLVLLQHEGKVTPVS
jgi:hypothetical protein